MALTKIKELNSLLDRFLQKSTNTGLNALIPYTYTTQGNLYWIDPHEHEQNMTEEEVDDAQAIINEMNILLMKTQDMTNENRKPNAMLFTAPSP